MRKRIERVTISDQVLVRRPFFDNLLGHLFIREIVLKVIIGMEVGEGRKERVKNERGGGENVHVQQGMKKEIKRKEYKMKKKKNRNAHTTREKDQRG